MRGSRKTKLKAMWQAVRSRGNENQLSAHLLVRFSRELRDTYAMSRNVYAASQGGLNHASCIV